MDILYTPRAHAIASMDGDGGDTFGRFLPHRQPKGGQIIE